MNPREQRGLIIAATCRLTPNGDGTWSVPSQTNPDVSYKVNLETKGCTCPDCMEGGFVCKHYFAASIVYKRDIRPDGTIHETKTITLEEKKVYTQDWPKYNFAQATEKRRLQVLLHDLCRNLPDREKPKGQKGPKFHRTRDAIFAMAFKVYCGLSARRFSTDLDEAHEKGYLTKRIPGIKVTSFFEDEYCTPILRELIAFSALPLRAVESDFAIDSSGFGTSRYERWYDVKYNAMRTRAMWVKAHVASGVKTNVVTAVRILEQHSGDSPQFVPLVKETSNYFEIDEVSADKAYISVENFEEVARCGGQAYMEFKVSNTGAAGGMLEKAFHYFQFNREEYMNHYHKRSNAESTFSMVKRKFGDSVRSKTDIAMKNEVYCKFLCHNLSCLIMEQEVLGITPVFWKDEVPQENGSFPSILRFQQSH